MLFEKLSDKEKELISKYIENYGANPDHDGMNYNSRASLDFVLRHWNHEKENLYHLLGDNLIIEKHFEIEVDNTRIVRNLEEMSESNKILHGMSYRKIFHAFWNWTNRISYENWDYQLKEHTKHWNDPIFDHNKTHVPVCDIQSEWFYYEHLAANTYDGPNCLILLPDTDKPYQVKHGMRLTRLIDRFLKAYPDDEFTESMKTSLVDLIAIARTSTHSSFTLCLSIHPLDYMTMSDNDNNWNSCMAWKDHCGDYRQGTVECMNSPAIVVAYIKDEEPMDLGFLYNGGEAQWANKAWRQLFLVTDGAIIADKGYPFQYDATVDIVMNWLQELAKENWSVEYDISGFISDNPGNVFTHGVESDIQLNVSWGYMYDDIGTLNQHKVVVNTTAVEEYKKATGYHQYDIQGSGASECMWCGGDIYTEDDEDDSTSSHVICEACAPSEERWQCDECGEYYHRDELTYVPDLDAYLCDDCYNERIFCDDFTGEMEWVSNEKQVYLAIGINSENELIALSNPISISDRDNYGDAILEKYFIDPEHMVTYMTSLVNIRKLRWAPASANFYNVVFESDLTERGLELFLNRSGYETIEMARKDYLVDSVPMDFITNLNRAECSDATMTIRLDDNDLTHHVW